MLIKRQIGATRQSRERATVGIDVMQNRVVRLASSCVLADFVLATGPADGRQMV